MFHLSIPGRPFAWKRADRDRRTNRVFTDKAAEAHKAMVAGLAIAAWGPRPPLFGSVKFFVRATFETPASWPKALREAALRGEVFHDSDPDFDNIAKQIADALKFVAFCDDAQIGDGRAILMYGAGERTELWLEALGAPGLQTPASRRREAKWRAREYDAAIAKAPCGAARWPSVIDASARSARNG